MRSIFSGFSRGAGFRVFKLSLPLDASSIDISNKYILIPLFANSPDN